MAESRELQLVINAKNEATSTLNSVSNDVNKLASSHDSMAKSVFTGVMAWDLLKQGIGIASNFIKESINLAKEAEVTTMRYNAVLNSIPNITDEARNAVIKYGNSLLQYGVDNENAVLATSKFLKATGDVQNATKMTKLALDLTASGFGDFESNVSNLNKVLIGKGQRAMMEYKISLDENATTLEQLNAIQKKATVSIEEWSNTTEGKTAIMKAKFDEVKEGLGGGFLPILNKVADAGMWLLDVLIKDAEGSNYLGKTLAIVGGIFEGLAKVVWGVLKMLGNLGAGVIQVGVIFFNVAKDIFNNWKNLGKALANIFEGLIAGMSGDFGKAKEMIMSAFSGFDFSSTKTSFSELGTILLGAGDAMEDVYSGVTTMISGVQQADSLKFTNIIKSFEDVEDATGSAGAGASKLAETFGKLKDAIQKTVDDSKVALDEVGKKITEIQNKMFELLGQKRKDDISLGVDVGTAFVNQENKIKELKLQIASETDAGRRALLQQQLSDEEAAYRSMGTWEQVYQSQIAEARRRASLTEFERTMEDLNNKKINLDDEYQIKLGALQNELDAELKKQKILQELNAWALKEADKFLAQSEKQTVDSINREIAYYNELAKAIAKAKSGQMSGAVGLMGGTNERANANNTTINIDIRNNTIAGSGGIDDLARQVGDAIVGKLNLNGVRN